MRSVVLAVLVVACGGTADHDARDAGADVRWCTTMCKADAGEWTWCSAPCPEDDAATMAPPPPTNEWTPGDGGTDV